MDPQCSGQDIMRCFLCKNDVAPLHCRVCFLHFCGDCVEKHTSDKSKVHNVVSFRQLLSIPMCSVHPTKQCNLLCEQCNSPICGLCISSEEHKHHDIVDIWEHCKNNQEVIRRDLQELDEIIYPKYREAASTIPARRADAEEHTPKVKAALKNQGESLHTEIDLIIQGKLMEIDDINSQILTAIDREEETLNETIKEIS
ncbi:E3 ubiquitin-protein ligase TRIM45-like [Crassostrea virginica]